MELDRGIDYGTRVRAGQLVVLAGVVCSLEYLARSGRVSAITLAAPTATAATLVELVRSGVLLDDLVRTATSVVVAFLAAAATGIPAGWVLARRRVLHRVLDPYLVSFYALPVFAFYPVLIAVFGLTPTPIVLIAYAMSVVAVVVNTASGLGEVPAVYREVGRSLGLSRTQQFVHVSLPAAAPYVFTGLKLGFVYATVGVLASEFILSDAGLGYLVAYSYRNFATEEMYAVMSLVVVLAVGVNLAIVWVEDRLYRRCVTRR